MRKIPWPRQDVCVCLIGYSGALFEVASVLAEGNVKIGTVVSHLRDAKPKEGIEGALAENGLFPSLREIAEKADAPFLYLPDPNAPDAIDQIREKGVNLVLSLSAPILKPAFIDAFDGWVFNFHGSHHYRGRAGLSWIILNGFSEDAVVLHWIDYGIDTGDVVAEAPYNWSDDAYPLDLFRAERPCIENLTRNFLAMLADGAIPKIPQNPSRPYFPSLITNEDGWIDWNWSPEEAKLAVRGFGWPYQGASALLENACRSERGRVQIGRCLVPRGALNTHPLANGCILASQKEGDIDVACGGGVLRIKTFRQGNDEIPAGNLARAGMRLRKGP